VLPQFQIRTPTGQVQLISQMRGNQQQQQLLGNQQQQGLGNQGVTQQQLGSMQQPPQQPVLPSHQRAQVSSMMTSSPQQPISAQQTQQPTNQSLLLQNSPQLQLNQQRAANSPMAVRTPQQFKQETQQFKQEFKPEPPTQPGQGQAGPVPIGQVQVQGGPQAQGGQQTNSSGQPVEFNHAISYVNKIKVAKLSLNDADLLREFKQFLPDASGNGAFGFGVASNTSTPVHSVS